MIEARMIDDLDLPTDRLECESVLRRATDLAEHIMATSEDATADTPRERLIIGLALQRCIAGFYARLAYDCERADLAPEIAGRAVRIAMEATAELAENLVRRETGKERAS
jgi:hypothetical protein